MEDVCAEDAPLGGVLLAHAALDQAGAPLAPGASPGGCAGWCARLNLVAVLSADAVRLVRSLRAGTGTPPPGPVGGRRCSCEPEGGQTTLLETVDPFSLFRADL